MIVTSGNQPVSRPFQTNLPSSSCLPACLPAVGCCGRGALGYLTSLSNQRQHAPRIPCAPHTTPVCDPAVKPGPEISTLPARREEEGLVSNQILSILWTENLFHSFVICGIQEFVGEVTFSDDCWQGARRARWKGPCGGGGAVVAP